MYCYNEIEYHTRGEQSERLYEFQLVLEKSHGFVTMELTDSAAVKR